MRNLLVPQRPPQTITASPNPVPAGEGLGTTTITWNTGDGTFGQVYVSADGGPEAPFNAAPSGSFTAGWIQVGQTYEFRLYAGTEHATLLSKTQVTRSKIADESFSFSQWAVRKVLRKAVSFAAMRNATMRQIII